jgi:hypothetical protein
VSNCLSSIFHTIDKNLLYLNLNKNLLRAKALAAILASLSTAIDYSSANRKTLSSCFQKRIDMRSLLFLLIVCLACSSCLSSLYRMSTSAKPKVSPYEQIEFTDMMKRYFSKDKTSTGTIEGIYSVSSLITKKGKGLLSSKEKEKVVDRNENYSKVAIIYDHHSHREYLEVPVDNDHQASYSIRGEFTGMSDGNIIIYKHFEARGKTLTYTFTYDKARDMLEGIRTENNGPFTFTYTLTYLKLFPKGAETSNR